jgi:hypothetical protein
VTTSLQHAGKCNESKRCRLERTCVTRSLTSKKYFDGKTADVCKPQNLQKYSFASSSDANTLYSIEALAT